MKLEEIKKELDQLNIDDVEELLQYIKDNKLINDYTSIILEALEYKYSDSFICPICGSSHVTKNGHYKNGLQRLYCHECQKSFSIYKGTILEGTKLPIVTWFKYLLIMSKDEDLRDCAQYAGVSLKTSFYMRHKIMNALANEMNTVKLEGIAEIDETNAYISYSGNFKKQNTNKELPRKSYQRGRKSMKHKYGLSYTDKIQIACAVDRKGNIFLKVAKIGTTTLGEEEVKSIYGEVIEGVSDLCTDGLYAYRNLCKEKGIKHHAFKNGDKRKRGIYHINHVNYIHSQIAKYTIKHNGISSKYLDEYLALIAYRIKCKNSDIKTFFTDLFQCHCTFRRSQYIGTDFITDNIFMG